MKKFYIKLLCIVLAVYFYSCSDPSQPAAKEAAADANNTDSSSSDEQFNKDTTIDLSSGGSVGIDMAKGDTIGKEGKASGGQ